MSPERSRGIHVEAASAVSGISIKKRVLERKSPGTAGRSALPVCIFVIDIFLFTKERFPPENLFSLKDSPEGGTRAPARVPALPWVAVAQRAWASYVQTLIRC